MKINIKILLTIIAITLVSGGVYLGINDISGWGWLIVAGFLIGYDKIQ